MHRRPAVATLVAAAALLAPAAASAAPVPVELSFLGRFGAGVETGAEIADHHAQTQRVFVTNAAANRLDVYDVADPAAPVARAPIDLAPYGATPNSVSVSRDGIVAVAQEAGPKSDPGTIVFLDTDGNLLDTATVGAQPDMVTFTPDDSRVVVANEGEPYVPDADEDEVPDAPIVDPPGTVSIVTPPRDGAAPGVTTLGFGAYDGVSIPGTHPGIPEVTDGAGNLVAAPAFSVDAEPEYVAVSADSSTAWVSLQERNAVARIDLTTHTIDGITGLGFKDHTQAANALDPSDRDGPAAGKAIDLVTAPLRGMYQPDAIAAYEAGGRTWLVTANEGDTREWPGYVVEEERAKDVALDAATFPDADALQEDASIGRLNVSTFDGRNVAGEHEALSSFGGRSMSVLDATGSLVHDTGDGLERLLAERQPELFNAEESDPSTWDERSDSKGPEPEGVATGLVGGRPYAFLGLERAGALVAYDLGDVPGESRFAGYAPSVAADRAPEGVVFVPAGDSPTGKPLVMATYEVSGTVAVYEVRGGPGPRRRPVPEPEPFPWWLLPQGAGAPMPAPVPAAPGPPAAVPTPVPAPAATPAPSAAPSAVAPLPARLTRLRVAGRTVRFSLTAPAEVRVRVDRLVRRCTSKRPRRCSTTARRAGTFGVDGVEGGNTVRVPARLVRRAGRYRVTARTPGGRPVRATLASRARGR